MSAETVDQIVGEMQALVHNLKTTYVFALAGLQRFAKDIGAVPPVADNPDPMIHVGVGDPNDPASVSLARWRRSEILHNTATGGPADALLGSQLLVTLFSYWENEFRPRLAAAHGCEASDLRMPVLGDIRRFRNDIIHNRSVASGQYTAKCEVLTWFSEGEEIAIFGDRVHAMTAAIPWDELRTGRSASDSAVA